MRVALSSFLYGPERKASVRAPVERQYSGYTTHSSKEDPNLVTEGAQYGGNLS